MPEAGPVDPRQLAITTRRESNTLVLQVAGEIDLATAPQLRAALRSSLDGAAPPAEVRVDLSGTSFLDAAGLGVLVESREAARRAGVGFSVHNPTGVVRRVLDIVGLTKSLQVEAARRHITRPAPPSSPTNPRTA